MKSKTYVMSGDFGKFNSKLIGRDIEASIEDLNRVIFRTNVHDLTEGSMDVEGNSFKVVYDNKEYIVGEIAQQNYIGSSKTNLIHKLSCYTAITKFLDPNTKGNIIKIVLACPISILKMQELKEEYKNYIKGDGEINITVDGNEYNFIIDEIMIKAEDSGIVYTNPELFEGKDVLIVGLGGLNQGLSLYRNKVCKIEDRHIEEAGDDELLKLIKDQIIIYNKGNIPSDDDARKALNENGIKKAGSIDPESTKFINQAKLNYFNKVMKNIKKYKIDIDKLDHVVFVGGTTQHIKDIITKDIKHAYIPNDSVWSTADGLYKVAAAKYINKK